MTAQTDANAQARMLDLMAPLVATAHDATTTSPPEQQTPESTTTKRPTP